MNGHEHPLPPSELSSSVIDLFREPPNLISQYRLADRWKEGRCRMFIREILMTTKKNNIEIPLKFELLNRIQTYLVLYANRRTP